MTNPKMSTLGTILDAREARRNQTMVAFQVTTFTTQDGSVRWSASRVGYVTATAWTYAELTKAISRENPDLDSRRIVLSY